MSNPFKNLLDRRLTEEEEKLRGKTSLNQEIARKEKIQVELEQKRLATVSQYDALVRKLLDDLREAVYPDCEVITFEYGWSIGKKEHSAGYWGEPGSGVDYWGSKVNITVVSEKLNCFFECRTFLYSTKTNLFTLTCSLSEADLVNTLQELHKKPNFESHYER